MSDNNIPTSEPGKISRRTLAAGVAWAVPAVAIAGAAPAHAVSGTTTTCVIPVVPSNLRQVGDTQRTPFALGWNASTGATSYEVRRCTTNRGNCTTSCTNWVDVGNATQYQFTGLSQGTTYCFQVRAKNLCGTSAGATRQGSTSWPRSLGEDEADELFDEGTESAVGGNEVAGEAIAPAAEVIEVAGEATVS